MSNLFPLIGVSGSDLFKNTQSLSFAAASSMRLTMTDANFGAFTLAKFAISGWWKRAAAGVNHTIMAQWGAAGNRGFTLNLNASDQFTFQGTEDGTNIVMTMTTNATYSDTSNWHHYLCYYDSANGTANDRCRIFIDGAEITSFATGTRPTAAVFDSAAVMSYGMRNSALFYDGLLDELAFFDNVLPSVTDLISGTPGSPKPIRSMTGLKSHLRADTAVTTDEILATAWTNVNSVAQSTDFP